MPEENWKCDKCGKPADMRVSSAGKVATICSKCMQLVTKNLKKTRRGK